MAATIAATAAARYRVLGVDPGSRITGYGVVDVRGGRLTHVDSGVISIDFRSPIEARLLNVFDQLSALIARHSPDLVSIEDLFHARNVRSAITLGQARGAALLAASRAGLPVRSYAPAEIKLTVAGSGRAEKGQIQQMVRAILALDGAPGPDAADALAAAICHAQRRQLETRIDGAVRRAR
ncbi:MAG: crossover junction endodeoxyribonuclease RuvC [Deltaproteobacteria bacterium]|nr:crossover junction endodeoxyribonuclease RuvC [Deltaproteobacteria bacterium]